MKIRYKISSCSSQNLGNPVSNLISNVGHWESSRFCTYPQQITLMFYEPAVINKIKIVAHQTKVPQKINLLYHLPTEENQNQFTKLGYIVFKQPKQQKQTDKSPQFKKTILKQLKVINNLQLKAQYLRLIISKNHTSKINFFQQVGISSIDIQGTWFELNISSVLLKNDSYIQVSNFTKDKISILNQFKQKFILKQQYNEANQVKQIIEQIKILTEHIKQLNHQKILLIQDQNYLQAKQLKIQIDKVKQKIDFMANNFYDHKNKAVNKFQIQQKKIKKKKQQSMLSRFKSISIREQYNNQNLDKNNENINEQTFDRNKQVQSNNNPDSFTQRQQHQDQNGGQLENSRLEHQQKIVPAIFNKLRNSDVQTDKYVQNQFLQDSKIQQTLPQQPEELSPSNQANASIMSEFYQKPTIRKLHSKHWQFRNQALQQILSNSKKQSTIPVSKNKLRSYLFVFNRIMQKQKNMQFILTAIDMMNNVTGMKVQQTDFKSQLTRQLQKTVILTLDKTNQATNQKIKMQAQKVIIRMNQSSIFGLGLIYHAIIRSYNDKYSANIKKIYLDNLGSLINNYNGNIKNSIPATIIDFTVKKLHDPNNNVRKSAINLLKSLKKVGYQERIKVCIAEQPTLKLSYLKELNLD